MIIYSDHSTYTGIASPGLAKKDVVFVWYEENDLSLFPSGYTPGAVTSPIPSPTTESPASVTLIPTNMSTGAKAGIGLGVGVIILTLGVALWGILRQRQRRRKGVSRQEVKKTAKPELDATSEKSPSSIAAELSPSNSVRKVADLGNQVHCEYS